MKWDRSPWSAPHEPTRREPYERREYKAVFADGTEMAEAYNAYVRTPDGSFALREVDHFEHGGARYERVRECTLARTYSGEPCSDWTCSNCGKTHCVHNAAKLGEFCSRCGALVTRVEMDPWNAAAADPEMRNGA